MRGNIQVLFDSGDPVVVGGPAPPPTGPKAPAPSRTVGSTTMPVCPTRDASAAVSPYWDLYQLYIIRNRVSGTGGFLMCVGPSSRMGALSHPDIVSRAW
eukprot:gene17143-biopygen2304